MEKRQCGSNWLLVLGYAILLVYGTLFPLDLIDSGTTVDLQQLFDWEGARKRLSLSDLLVNLLVYLPWGYLLCRCLACLHWTSAFIVTVLAGTGLSFGLEFIQLYLPSRVTSFSDIVLNTVGTALGALAAISLQFPAISRVLQQLRERYVVPGALGDLGILVIGIWTLSELTPLVPSLDFGNLKHGFKPFYLALQNPELIQWHKMMSYLLNLCALGLLLRWILSSQVYFWRLFLLVFGGVLLLKVPVVSRQLSIEACLGFAGAGLWLVLLSGTSYRRWMLWFGGICLIAARILEALAKGDGIALTTYPFNWIPFAGQGNGVIGLIDILVGVWPYLALAFFAQVVTSSRWILNLGAMVVFSLALSLEWQQQFIPGRYPDATDAYLALAGWLFAGYFVRRRQSAPRSDYEYKGSRKRMYSLPFWIFGAVGLVTVAGVIISKFQSRSNPYENHEELLFPDPYELRPPSFAHFRIEHPRLPVPSPIEVYELRQRNQRYLNVHRRRARGGRGDFFSIALTGRIDPTTIDLAEVTRRLLDLNYSWRGHEQAMPIALVYDWLYPHFSPEQRKALQGKLAEGCQYLIHRIRQEALSPYNVYLYNSPFQALMAVAIALYDDHPYGDQCMAFTYDLWKNRMLPVWRQVMGRNGGWHEGGEYVGIGIGRAVYSLPSMWRKATGEDLFKTEPGIRGFLDFLIYRYRPDGFHMRWGDGAFFNKWVPQRFALALEYRDRAAYGFFGCHHRFEPTAWPWGPLPDESLCDRDAYKSLPLQKLFDGIGMVIARSDWSDDATYVTFKAGDNYWSHMHLEQGAFTLYKGGPLAIDSGLYGPKYGADHHMNYSYQTIAHNVITVTDPDDTALLPGKDKKPPRPIANDGGQRRVGSGWGKRAPIDLREWQELSVTYHTGRIARYFEGKGMVVAVAELTPAYTNRHCGRGDAFTRTCRVSRYWRTFLYDRTEDVVVVYDDIKSTDPDFVKRSLVHSIERPRLRPGGFRIEVPPKPLLHRQGGTLEVDVLFPRDAYLNPVGGSGFEFWVDGRNYDGNGEVWQKVARLREPRPEPGRWRVEIVPPEKRKRDRFLMVLRPSLLGERNHTRLERLQRGGSLGCRLKGQNRTVTLLFPADREGVVIEMDRGTPIDLTVRAGE